MFTAGVITATALAVIEPTIIIGTTYQIGVDCKFAVFLRLRVRSHRAVMGLAAILPLGGKRCFGYSPVYKACYVNVPFERSSL